jgi:hypothetical protein
MGGDVPDVAPLDKGGLTSQIRNENFDEGSTGDAYYDADNDQFCFRSGPEEDWDCFPPVTCQTGPEDDLHQCGFKTTVLEWLLASSRLTRATAASRLMTMAFPSLSVEVTPTAIEASPMFDD